MKSSIKLSGHSMYPLIQNLDSVEVDFFDKPINISEVSHGQVVLLKDQEEWLVHRVVKENQNVMSKGDWSTVFDDKALLVWGKVIEINGQKNTLLKSKRLAQISLGLQFKKPRWVRWFNRLQLILVVSLSKFKCGLFR